MKKQHIYNQQQQQYKATQSAYNEQILKTLRGISNHSWEKLINRGFRFYFIIRDKAIS